MKGMKLRKVLCLVLAAVLAFGGILVPSTKANAAEAPKYRNVMYYGDWSVYAGQNYFNPSDIDGSQITHLNFAFMDVDKSGNLVLCDEFADFDKLLPEQTGLPYGAPYGGVLGGMVILRNKYPNMKIGISVGGWTRSGDFPAMAGNAAARKNFAQNIAKFVDYLGFDFVDIDWEYPCDVRASDSEGNGVTIDKGCAGTPEDGKNFTLLMQDIRSELDKLGATNGKHYELSAAMSASPTKMAEIEYDKVLDTVDFLNMMTYDLCGAWAPYTGHQTALYTNPAYDSETQPDCVFSVDTCIKYLENTYGSKIDYSKIVVGVTSYTRGWCGVQNDGKVDGCPGLFATADPNSVKAKDGVPSGTFAYSELDELISKYQLKEYWDDAAKAAYFYSPETGYFFTCDTPKSVSYKGEYVRNKGLGGLICWMASQDADGVITKAMKESLYGNEALPDQEIIVSTPDVSLTVKKAANQWGGAGTTYTFTLKNNEKAVESNTALKRAEEYKKSVMNPMLYIKTDGNVTFTAGEGAGKVTNSNGLCIVDLSSVYGANTMLPGATHTFTLSTSSSDAPNVVSVTLTQRITTAMHEFGEQVIYGDGEVVKPTTEPTVKPTTEPTTEPTVKPTEPKPTEPKPTEPKPTEPAPTEPAPTEPVDDGTWDPSKVYVGGDTVKYGGKTYKAKWWTMGEKPGESAVWELVSGGSTKPTDPSKPDTGNAWSASKVYVGGDKVTHNGKEYKAKWWTLGDEPGKNAVWELIGGTVDPEPTTEPTTEPTVKPTTEPTTEPTVKPTTEPTTEPTVKPTAPSEPVDATGLGKHIVVGYWHNFCNGSTNLRLSDVPVYYDMIDVAFTGNSSTPGEATFEIDSDLSRALGGYTDADFIADIKAIQAQGRKVIISVGGAEGRISITSDAAANTFAESMIAIIEKYGFDGIDIDLEGGAVAGTAYIASSLRKMHDHFGDKFIITMAPETAYIQNAQGTYLKLALEIKDILTICYPQFYNSGAMDGYDKMGYRPGTADFITAQLTTLVESGLRPDQVGIGLPCVPSAAGSGYITNDIIEKAVTAFVTGTKGERFIAPSAYPGLRAMMTWSVNWDATNNYAWGKAMSDLMDKVDDLKPVEPDPDVVGKTTWDPSKVYVGGDTVLYNGKTYQAKWWTQGNNPSDISPANPWQRIA